MSSQVWKTVIIWVISLAALLAVACGGAAATPAPPTTAPTSALQPTATPVAEATPTPAPTATPLPSDVTSARDRITLVMPEEPVQLSSLNTIGASLNESVTKVNVQDPLTWQ